MLNDGVAKLPRCSHETRRLSDGHVDGVEAKRSHEDAIAATASSSKFDGAEGASRDAAAARRDDRAREGVAAVHPNPKALARAPELDAADVRSKIFFGVFGRHARLDRVAPDLDVVLAVQTCVEINQ